MFVSFPTSDKLTINTRRLSAIEYSGDRCILYTGKYKIEVPLKIDRIIYELQKVYSDIVNWQSFQLYKKPSNKKQELVSQILQEWNIRKQQILMDQLDNYTEEIEEPSYIMINPQVINHVSNKDEYCEIHHYYFEAPFCVVTKYSDIIDVLKESDRKVMERENENRLRK